MKNDFMSPEELSEYLDIPLQTIYSWRMTPGKGPRGMRVGRHVRYRRGDVEKWLDGRADERAS